jgi:hypothetical protein
MSGFSAHVNASGFWAVRLHYSASEEKNVLHPDPDIAARAQAWYERAKRLYPDPRAWDQEMEIGWFVSQGTRVYPEFSEAVHGAELDGFRERKVIYRAWDFGYLTPACLIAQIDSKDRLVILKEVVGREQITRTFAQQVIQSCTGWFPQHTAGFEDFCDPAGQKRSPNASEKSEARDVEVLNKLGIHPSWEYGWGRKDGRSLVHQLLQIRLDGTPSIYINVGACPVLVQGFLGKYVFPPGMGGQIKDEPDEANHPWADVHAALRYLATGLYSALGLRRVKTAAAGSSRVDHHGYGTPLRRARRAS